MFCVYTNWGGAPRLTIRAEKGEGGDVSGIVPSANQCEVHTVNVHPSWPAPPTDLSHQGGQYTQA